jgi:hypothetical protein
MSFQADLDTVEKKTGQTPRKVVAGYFLSLDGVEPVGSWSGQRLFDGLPPIRLETIRSTASPIGHLLVDYRVVR